jgi:hypothetical protein
MSIITYATQDSSVSLSTYSKQNIAQYIFDNGITHMTDMNGGIHITIDNYVMLGKHLIKILNTNEKPQFIHVQNSNDRKIILTIANKIIVDMIPLKSIYDGDIVIIRFEDEYTNKINSLNCQYNPQINKLTIIKTFFRAIIRYIISFLCWIGRIKNNTK